ncbi:D-arabinitol dehydrogenase 1 [Eumeta japonica]|uniref:D-arabinitol dehydrogenase 1 n=1 Tax=Eumeta variegata TaxID=151549 RepID=A0A4C1X2W5_EUMVA|nr:D-arabinitol dehydrogenase 1 [Eumeta japonica]
MEAVVFDGMKLKVSYQKDFPIPKIVNDDDVIIKVAYAGVCGTDLHIIQGEFPALKTRPLPLGHEFSGVILDVGEKSIFKKGQKVAVDPNSGCNLCDNCRMGNYHHCSVGGMNSTVGLFSNGGWAQYCIVPQSQVYALPDEITLEQGALCEPYSCVAHGFDRASPLKVGAKILVAGAGIIGNLWITTLHLQGHRDVTVCEMNKTRLEIVNRLKTGYRLVTPDILEKEKAEFDVIIDCTGVGKVMEVNVQYLRTGGKYVLFGCCPATHQATLNPFQIYQKELTIIGININPFSFPNAIGWIKAMGDRYVNYESLGIKTYALSEFQNALDDLKKGLVSKAIFKKLYFFGIIKNEPKLDGVASFNYGVPMATFSSIITPWLPYSIKVLVKSNQTSPNSMGLRRLITEFLWLPSAPSSRPGYHIASKYSSSRIKRAQTRWGCAV